MDKQEIKKYFIMFGDDKTIAEYTDEQLLDFIKTAVIRNRDVKSFSVIEINRDIKP